ncbi:hypothetical protein JXL19_04250 [bacterium]|nr:hypothetical protein [bacterium]
MGFKRFFFANFQRLESKGVLDILEIGGLRFQIKMDQKGLSLDLETKTSGINHSALLGFIIAEGNEQGPPALQGINISGCSVFKLRAMIDETLMPKFGTKENENPKLFSGETPMNFRFTMGNENTQKGFSDESGGWRLSGEWKASFPSIDIPACEISISGLTIELPLELAASSFCEQGPFTDGRSGVIRIKKVSWLNGFYDDLELHPMFSQNRFQIKDPVYINIFGGEVFLRELSGAEIISKNAVFQASIGIKALDLMTISKGSGFPVSGRLDGDIPHLTYKNDRIDFTGSLYAEIFGGGLDIKDIYLEMPFSQGRRLGGSIFWDGIGLDKLTERVPIGKISGVIKGKLTDFVIEYGQPARFLMEVESVKQKGVRQKISVDAINNLSMIGTGSSGVQSVLNSGLNRFFSYYPYSKIGFRCELRNDIFSLRGLIQEDGQEFIIRKGLFRGIDMVNQNPDNIISFKDMRERINRIFEDRGTAVKVN